MSDNPALSDVRTRQAEVSTRLTEISGRLAGLDSSRQLLTEERGVLERELKDLDIAEQALASLRGSALS